MHVSYDTRHYLPFSQLHIIAWNNSIKYNIQSGCITTANTHKPLRHGTIKNSDYLESKHPGYLHSLYWYATRTLGVKDSFTALVISMNKKSRTHNEIWCIVNLSRVQLNGWFIEHDDREYSAEEKPLDLSEHRQKILVRQYFALLLRIHQYGCYVDKKFFYVTSRGDNIKKLPLGEHRVAVSKKCLFLKWYCVTSLLSLCYLTLWPGTYLIITSKNLARASQWTYLP